MRAIPAPVAAGDPWCLARHRSEVLFMRAASPTSRFSGRTTDAYQSQRDVPSSCRGSIISHLVTHGPSTCGVSPSLFEEGDLFVQAGAVATQASTFRSKNPVITHNRPARGRRPRPKKFVKPSRREPNVASSAIQNLQRKSRPFRQPEERPFGLGTEWSQSLAAPYQPPSDVSAA